MDRETASFAAGVLRAAAVSFDARPDKLYTGEEVAKILADTAKTVRDRRVVVGPWAASGVRA